MSNDNEIVVARLSGGANIVLRIGPDDQRMVKVLLRRNKHAKLPASRILFKTGLFIDDFSGILKFRDEISKIVSGIDIKSLWQNVKHSKESFSIQKLSSIYWDNELSPQKCTALTMVIESKESIYFEVLDNRYVPREDAKVIQLEQRIRNEEKLASEELEFSEILRGIRQFSQLTDYQKRLLGYLRDFVIGGNIDLNGSKARDFLQKYKFSGELRRTAFELLLKIGELKLDDPIELERENIRVEFSTDVMDEVKSLNRNSAQDSLRRVDLRSLDLFTIDNSHTIDRDDALSVKVLSHDQNGHPNQVQIGIHIADASDLISSGGFIDLEAEKRMSTIYFPENTVWMVPKFLIETCAGLNPGVDRFALTVLVDFSIEGEVLNWEIVPSIINSKIAMSYEEADTVLDNDRWKWNKQIHIINLIAKKLKAKRIKSGALDLLRREMEIKIDVTEHIDITIAKSLISRDSVAEFMILYNHLLAKYCHNFNIPAIYRSQESPTNFDPFHGYEDGPFKNHLVFKQLQPVLGANDLSNHWGLGLQGYIQSTSPLRRYTDMIMQRQISNHLQFSTPIYSLDDLSLIFMKSVDQLKLISRLEAERAKFWFSKFLIQRSELGERYFRAVVLEKRHERNALLELDEYPFKIRMKLSDSILPGDKVLLEFQEVDWIVRQPKFKFCDKINQ